jgi:hypothetical protein
VYKYGFRCDTAADLLPALGYLNVCFFKVTEVEFLKSLWGLRTKTKEEEGYRSGPPELVFVVVLRGEKSIPGLD